MSAVLDLDELGLGRRVNHDPRSRAFPARMVPPTAPLVPVMHRHFGPVLDQGSLGSCTGNAAAQAMNSRPLHLRATRYLTQADAVSIYSDATKIDPWEGEYPPTDTGSDGLSVAKVLKARGYISEYRHTFTWDGFRRALQLAPLLVGINWYMDMYFPDRKGNVHVGGAWQGGHEVLALGDDARGHITFLNSWGPKWGRAGRFRLSYWDFQRLLLDEQGDATQLVPR